ncbi:hypothetical protein Ahia01_000633800 [Argonauta hians]
MELFQVYFTVVLSLICILTQHVVHSDLWENLPAAKYNCPHDLIGKQFVRKLLSKLPEQSQPPDENNKENHQENPYQLNIALSKCEQYMLYQFVHEQANLDDVIDVLSHMIKAIEPIQTGVNSDDADDAFFPSSYFSSPIEMYFIIAMSVLVSFIFLFNIFTTRKLWRTAILMFFINVLWNWFYLFEEERAKTMQAVDKGPPEGCSGRRKAISSIVLDWFTMQRDECQTYIALITINPFFRVRPYEAVSISVVNSLLKPLQYCGTYFSSFINDFCAPLPPFLQPFVLLLLFAMFVVSMLILCGYSLSLPFVSLRKENTTTATIINNSNNKLEMLLEKLEENRISTEDQVKDLTNLLKNSIKDLEELKSLQQANDNLAIAGGGDS